MSASPAQTLKIGPHGIGTTSRTIVTGAASNELIFAVVGHVGSGTSEVADALAEILPETEMGGQKFEIEVIKARDVIIEWAAENGLTLAEQSDRPTLAEVQVLQDIGDKMRGDPTLEGKADHAAVARGMVGRTKPERSNLMTDYW